MICPFDYDWPNIIEYFFTQIRNIDIDLPIKNELRGKGVIHG